MKKDGNIVKSLYNKNYLPSVDDDHLIVNRIFHYIENYLYEHEEKDHLNMDFVESIITFCNTFLISIYFKSEESVLFNNLHDLSIDPSIENKMKEVTNEQHSIEQVAKQLSLLQSQYNAGDNSCIEKIHSLLRTLTASYNKLTIKEKELFPLINKILSNTQKEKLNNDLLQFNQNIIKELVNHSIIEKYQKYNIISK